MKSRDSILEVYNYLVFLTEGDLPPHEMSQAVGQRAVLGWILELPDSGADQFSNMVDGLHKRLKTIGKPDLFKR